MNHYFYYILFITCFFTRTLSAGTVTIVDCNQQQVITDYLPQEQALIAIFGATPRYSFYTRYRQTVVEHLHSLTNAYQKSKRLKGVPHTIKSALQTLVNHVSAAAIVPALAHYPSSKHIELFLEQGINQTHLKDNIQALLSTINKLRSNYLVHFMLPHYFRDCTMLTDDELSVFLTHSAQFYKQLYESVAQNFNITVLIVIPPLFYFKKLLEQQVLDIHHSIADVLYHELMCIFSAHDYALINPLISEMEPVVQQVYTYGIDRTRICIAELALYNGFTKLNTFTPYILKPEKAYINYTESPVITPELIDSLARLLS